MNLSSPKTDLILEGLQSFFYTNQIVGDIYEFGVYSGTSLGCIKKIMANYNINCKHIFGFDSFEGLPQETQDQFNYKTWFKGNYDSRNLFKINDVDRIVKNMETSLKTDRFNLQLIKGFFKDSLQDSIVNEYNMQPASFINMDCDQYTSAYEALDFMARNNLIQTGTVIRYDDWGGTPEFLGGESKAHQEICEKYKMTTELLIKKSYGGPHIKTLYLVKSIG